MRLGRAVVVLVVSNVLTFGLLAEPSMGMTTWSGTCTYKGWSQFWPKRRWVPVPSGYHYRGRGQCEGILNGKPFKGRSVIDNYADMKQPMGCPFGGSTYGGPVYMTFVTDDEPYPPADEDPPRPPPSDEPTPQPPAPNTGYPVLQGWTDEVSALHFIESDLFGAYRGVGVGHGQMEQDPDQVRQCSEEGIPGLMLTTTYKTVTELRG